MRSHRELFAWQKANSSAVAIYRFCQHSWSPRCGYAIDQLRRASLSVPINLAEGHAMGRGARCRFHTRVAYGSAVETTALLEFLDEVGLETTALLGPSREVQALTLRLLQSLK